MGNWARWIQAWPWLRRPISCSGNETKSSMALPWGIDMSRGVCVHACTHTCTCVWVAISSKYHRHSLPEGMAQTLNPCYHKEAAQTLGLLLTWLSTEGFSSFHEQRKKLRGVVSGSVCSEQGVQSTRVCIHRGCHRDMQILITSGKTKGAA